MKIKSKMKTQMTKKLRRSSQRKDASNLTRIRSSTDNKTSQIWHQVVHICNNWKFRIRKYLQIILTHLIFRLVDYNNKSKSKIKILLLKKKANYTSKEKMSTNKPKLMRRHLLKWVLIKLWVLLNKIKNAKLICSKIRQTN